MMKLRDCLLMGGSLAIAGCTTIPRMDTPPLESLGAEPAGFTQPIRTDSLDRTFFEAHADTSLAAVQAVSDGSIDLLALSGGGAGGAYGAGVLVGLTDAKARPRFEVVTGVSTGALIAPFAFLGPEWDAQLTEAYRGEATNGLLVSRGVGALFGVGVFEGRPLRKLVDRFVTQEMVDAIGKEAAKGRILLVATTNLDREETQIWNMGVIAQQGGPSALKLFRDVLVASASVPGVFPPVMIEVEKDGKKYQEMHVDGGASIPFLVAPDIALILGYSPEGLKGAHIYVVVNGQSASAPRATKNNTVDVAARSFSSVLNHMTRTALGQTAAFAQRSGADFHFTTIPRDVEFGGSLAFDEKNMRAIFDYGRRCASASEVWVTPEDALRHVEIASSTTMPPDKADCPLLRSQ